MEAKQLGLGPFEERFPPITSNTKGWTKFARVSLAQPLSLSLVAVAKSWIHCALCMQIRLPLGASVWVHKSMERRAYVETRVCSGRNDHVHFVSACISPWKNSSSRNLLAGTSRNRYERLDCSPVTIATCFDETYTLRSALNDKRDLSRCRTRSSIRDIPRENVNFWRVEQCHIDDTASFGKFM